MDLMSLQLGKYSPGSHGLRIFPQKSESQLRLYFESEERAEMWYDEILREQGFPRESLMEQYEILDDIDSGAHGQVALASHLRSESCYAIKGLSKSDMETMFEGSGESCAEE